MQKVTFHDHKPATLNFYDAVINGLSLKRKSIPPKFFYDEWGSKLFERICEQPEYYPPTVERRMLIQLADEIASLTGGGRILIEPGAGNAAKAFPGVGTLAGGLMHAVAYGLIFDALGRAVLRTLETRGELRPAPASLTFRDNLVTDVESQARRLLRLALDIRKEQDDNKNN